MGTWLWAVESPNPSAHYVVIHKISDILCRNSVPQMVIGWGACGEYVKVTGIITDLIFEHPDRMDFHCGVFIVGDKNHEENFIWYIVDVYDF